MSCPFSFFRWTAGLLVVCAQFQFHAASFGEAETEGLRLASVLSDPLQDQIRATATAVNDLGPVNPAQIPPAFSDENWISMGGLPGADGFVRAAMVDASGSLQWSDSLTAKKCRPKMAAKATL